MVNIERYLRKFGLLISLGWASYKAFDNHNLYVKEVDKSENKQEIIDQLREANDLAEKGLESILYNIAANSVNLDIIPLPIWYKIYNPEENRFQMVFINEEFERRYNVSMLEYLGKQDEKVFSDEVAEEFENNDFRAYWSRTPVYVWEPDNNGRIFPVVKWRVDRGNEIFIYGMELPSAEEAGYNDH